GPGRATSSSSTRKTSGPPVVWMRTTWFMRAPYPGVEADSQRRRWATLLPGGFHATNLPAPVHAARLRLRTGLVRLHHPQPAAAPARAALGAKERQASP